jgi:hypothetical protein
MVAAAAASPVIRSKDAAARVVAAASRATRLKDAALLAEPVA